MTKKQQPNNKLSEETLEAIKKKLESEKTAIESELSKIAVLNEKVPGDWQSKFPYGNHDTGTASLERQADEVEEYSMRLPLEHQLETKLAAINEALQRIEKGTYGICLKCGKAIPLQRLEIFPEAGLCLNCQQQ